MNAGEYGIVLGWLDSCCLVLTETLGSTAWDKFFPKDTRVLDNGTTPNPPDCVIQYKYIIICIIYTMLIYIITHYKNRMKTFCFRKLLTLRTLYSCVTVCVTGYNYYFFKHEEVQQQCYRGCASKMGKTEFT